MLKKKLVFLGLILLLTVLFVGCISFVDNEKDLETSPVGVVFAADTSGSMSGDAIVGLREGLIAFVGEMNPEQDKVGLIEYGNINVVMDFGSISRDENDSGRLDIIEEIESLGASGGTPLWEATYKSVEMAAEHDREDMSMAVIVLTDGRANNSKLNAVIDLAQEKNIPIYTIGLGNVNQDDLIVAAEETDASFKYTPEPDELKDIYLELYQEMQNDQIFDEEPYL